MATIHENVFACHSPITLGFLRNGPAVNVARTARESSIPAKYYYTGVRYFAGLLGNGVTRVPKCPTAVVLEAQIRCAFTTIVEAKVAEARDAHAAATGGAAAGGAVGGAAAAAFDAAAARTAERGSQANRLEAIAIGATRTALVLSYRITTADLRATEATPTILRVVAPAGAADAAALAALNRRIDAGWEIRLSSGNADAAATPAERTCLDMAALTTEEAQLAFACVAIGQASPIRAGAQLFADGHHYHSDAEASPRHRAIEKEVLGSSTTAIRNIWRANVMMFRNAIWHAAIHPVDGDVLQGLAEDADMPERLDATGYGSFSVGLPAQEDLFNRAGSYTAVLNQVLQTASAHGHELSLAALEGTVVALKALPRRGALPAERPALPGAAAAPWPPGCDTRAKALKLFLEPALNKAEPVAAWMFGFYREICSRAGIRASSQEGSLLRSYSLKRAVGNYLGEANRAQEMYSARARYIRAQGEEGKLEVYKGSA
jgi:hypothetical protein